MSQDTGSNAHNWVIEFYLSLVSYFILHMIFVIAGDFIDAFNIPPLNIGIYIDKLAAIRALLMVIADIVEWLITQKAFQDHSMSQALKTSIYGEGKGARRLGSILSFLAMLGCRSYYLYLIYYSDNKSFSVFIVLCIEGFWFGIFQMGFFAIGPQYNAVTSLGIHTMGNFIFFFQLILQHYSKKYPKINPLYRVRVHGWICLVNSVIALFCWIYFCGWEDAGIDKAETAFNAIKTAVTGTDGLTKADGVDGLTDLNKKGEKLAEAIKNALKSPNIPGEITKLIKTEFGLKDAEVDAKNITTESGSQNNNKIVVTIKIGGGNETGKIVQFVFKDTSNTSHKSTVELQVKKAKTKKEANRIAWRLGEVLTQVKQVKTSGNEGTGTPKDVTVTKLTQLSNPINVLSPLLLFPVGSAAKDFLYPAILPFAFLDNEKANLVNYLAPAFFMIGAIVIVLLNDFFHPNGFAKSVGDSWFKDWSEGEAPWWNALWAGNIPKYIAFFIMIWSIHGTFPRLRCIVQSRWRVMLLTMFIIIPRTILEVAGYVGVANYAILSAATGDFNAFTYIAIHDMLAMFCRFFYGKLAVGYNWTRISLGYCLPKFRPRHKGFGFGFWWWFFRTFSRAWADTVKDFKADIKDYL